MVLLYHMSWTDILKLLLLQKQKFPIFEFFTSNFGFEFPCESLDLRWSYVCSQLSPQKEGKSLITILRSFFTFPVECTLYDLYWKQKLYNYYKNKYCSITEYKQISLKVRQSVHPKPRCNFIPLTPEKSFQALISLLGPPSHFLFLERFHALKQKIK